MITITGFPRSGNHRIRQTVASLIYKHPFELADYQRLDEDGIPKSHSRQVEGKAIFVVRDPVDVMCSCKNFLSFLKTWDDAYNYVAFGAKARWGNSQDSEVQIGSWADHVRTFSKRPDTLIVKYEDFSEEQVKAVASFIGADHNTLIISEWNTKERIRQLGGLVGNRPHMGLMLGEAPVEFAERLKNELRSEMTLMRY